MERTYRASAKVYVYALLLAIDAAILGWEASNRLSRGALPSGAIVALLALGCLLGAWYLVWRWGRLRVSITRDALVIRGPASPRRLYWADVDRVREIRGPAYQLSLRRLLPGPYLPDTLLRGETVLELVARPGTRLVLRRALIDGYEALRQDVLRSISKTAEVDLHARWWRDTD
jgi:hypothetical protein